jgi:hypothetical protein
MLDANHEKNLGFSLKVVSLWQGGHENNSYIQQDTLRL